MGMCKWHKDVPHWAERTFVKRARCWVYWTKGTNEHD